MITPRKNRVDRIGAAFDAQVRVTARHRQASVPGVLGNGQDIDTRLRQAAAACVPQGVECHPLEAGQFASLNEAVPEIMGFVQVLADKDQVAVSRFEAPHALELFHQVRRDR